MKDRHHQPATREIGNQVVDQEYEMVQNEERIEDLIDEAHSLDMEIDAHVRVLMAYPILPPSGQAVTAIFSIEQCEAKIDVLEDMMAEAGQEIAWTRVPSHATLDRSGQPGGWLQALDGVQLPSRPRAGGCWVREPESQI